MKRQQPSEIVVKVGNETFRIYFKGLIHLVMRRIDVIGVQSYYNHEKTLFTIEYTTEKNTIVTEYEKEDVWKFILKEIEKQTPFYDEE